MKVYIFMRGEFNEIKFYRKHFDNTWEKGDILICVDGGYDFTLSMGLKPHYLIGDLDSFTSGKKSNIYKSEGIEIISYPREKDFSDFELSLKKAEELHPEKIFVYGATGGRIDHQIVNIILLAYYHIPMIFIDRGIEVYNVLKEIILEGKKGKVCTLISFGDVIKVKLMRGFLYSMEGEILKPSSRGLSNEITKDEIRLEIEGKGVILLINS